MSDFRRRILDAAYRVHGVDAALSLPEGAPAPCRVIMTRDSGEGQSAAGMGMMMRPVADAVLLRLRVWEPALGEAKPVKGTLIAIGPDAPIRAGEVFEVIAEPRRLDPGRLEWTCTVSALPDGEGGEGGEP